MGVLGSGTYRPREVLLIAGAGTWHAPLLITAGSGVLLIVFAAVLRIQAQAFVVVMAAGALAWVAGNTLWLSGTAVYTVVWWWMGFLVLTIAGERLELSRMLMHAPNVQRIFLVLIAFLGLGLFLSSVTEAGVRPVGAALVLLAFWLLRYDVARRTIRQKGLTRFIAVCLVTGYAWLTAGGLLLVAYGAIPNGPLYDAALHAIFVGFVFSMIFGHAPIVFPSVLGVPLAYRPVFYIHLALLHLSLVVRVFGNLAGMPGVRHWGGLLNAAAILLFIGVTIVATAVTALRKNSSDPS